MKLQAYLNFDGQAEEAFQFYRSVFGGEFDTHMKMADGPGGKDLPDKEKDRTMHISLPISKDVILMGSDTLPSAGQKLKAGNQMYISLHPESRQEADRLFIGLSKEGNVEMPMEDQFWGDYFGSFTDRFGVNWMINYSPAKSPAININTVVQADIDKIWKYWNQPEYVTQWNNASPDWHTTQARNDLRKGGQFAFRMEAKDGSSGFDFGGKYTEVIENKKISYVMDDGREVTVTFNKDGEGVLISESFEPEKENPEDMQRKGWQSILDNFKAFAERN